MKPLHCNFSSFYNKKQQELYCAFSTNIMLKIYIITNFHILYYFDINTCNVTLSRRATLRLQLVFNNHRSSAVELGPSWTASSSKVSFYQLKKNKWILKRKGVSVLKIQATLFFTFIIFINTEWQKIFKVPHFYSLKIEILISLTQYLTKRLNRFNRQEYRSCWKRKTTLRWKKISLF